MNKIKAGGPAFPLQSIGPDFTPGYAGMTLRDYFAAKALQGLLASSEFNSFEGYASAAYTAADAMLAERAKGMKDDR
jgi:hypothetical protein